MLLGGVRHPPPHTALAADSNQGMRNGCPLPADVFEALPSLEGLYVGSAARGGRPAALGPGLFGSAAAQRCRPLWSRASSPSLTQGAP